MGRWEKSRRLVNSIGLSSPPGHVTDFICCFLAAGVFSVGLQLGPFLVQSDIVRLLRGNAKTSNKHLFFSKKKLEKKDLKRKIILKKKKNLLTSNVFVGRVLIALYSCCTSYS